MKLSCSLSHSQAIRTRYYLNSSSKRMIPSWSSRFSPLFLFLPHSSSSISHPLYPSYLPFLLKSTIPTSSIATDEWDPPKPYLPPHPLPPHVSLPSPVSCVGPSPTVRITYVRQYVMTLHDFFECDPSSNASPH